MPLQQLEYEVSFSEKKHCERHILKLFFIEMPVSLKVFVPEKRDCTFWKWQNLSFKLLCWHVEIIFIQMLLEIIKCHTNIYKENEILLTGFR